MSKPANNNTWANTIWNGAPYQLAEKMQNCAQGAWNWGKNSTISRTVEAHWKGYTPETKETVKKVAAAAAGLAVTTLVGTAASEVNSSLGGCGTVFEYGASFVGSLALGAATTTYRWLNQNSEEAKESVGNGLLQAGLPAAVGITCNTVNLVSSCFFPQANAAFWAGSVGSLATEAATLVLHPATSVVAGTVYGGYRKFYKKDTAAEAVGAGAIATGRLLTGRILAGTNSPMVAGVFGTSFGSLTALTTTVATHPGLTTLIEVDDQKLRVDNPRLDGAKPLPADPSAALKTLKVEVDNFRLNHPAEHTWENPDDAFIENLKAREDAENILKYLRLAFKSQREISKEDIVRELRNNPGANRHIIPSDAEIAAERIRLKIDKIREILQGWGVQADNLSLSLLEKLEAIPGPSDVYLAAIKETDKQLDLLVKNASQFTTLYFIHCNRLGLGVDPADKIRVNAAFRLIIKEFSELENTSTTLWDVYMRHLGADLGFFQTIQAGFWYFLVYTVGIFPKIFEAFSKNIGTELRKPTQANNVAKLPFVFNKALELLSKLLEVYNGSLNKYVESDPINPNKLADWKKLAIDQLGYRPLYERLMAEPGTNLENIGDKMMTELSKDLTNHLVNQCFPTIEFFKDLKEFSLGGVRLGIVFDALDWVVGGVLNFLARESTRFLLPGITKSLVKIGLATTLPGQYSFKIAIANALTDQVKKLHEDFKNPTATKPPRLVTDPLIVGVIKGVADRLIDALRIKIQLDEDPKKPAVKKFLETLNEQTATPEVEKQLRPAIIEATQLLIYLYSEKPEKMEELFGTLFRQSNKVFEINIANDTPEAYNTAKNGLQISCKDFLDDAVKAIVEKKIKGSDPKTIHEFMVGKKDRNDQIIEPGIYQTQRDKGIRSFSALLAICADMQQKIEDKNQRDGTLFLTELDHFAETLKEFASDAAAIEIELYPAVVQEGFYTTFHPIYQQAVPLAKKAAEIQGSATAYDKHFKIARSYQELMELIARGEIANTELLKQKLVQIRKIGKTYGTEIPDLEEMLVTLKGLIKKIEEASAAAEEQRKHILKIAPFGAPHQFADKFLENPKEWIEKIRESMTIEDQNAIFPIIRALQIAASQIPRPDLLLLKDDVKIALEDILQKHMRLKEDQTGLKNDTCTEFSNLIKEEAQKAIEKRDNLQKTIKRKLRFLSDNTEKLRKKIDATQMPDLYFPLQHLPSHVVDFFYKWKGKPIVEQIDTYFKAGFELITNNDIYEGVARLGMGAVIKEANEHWPQKTAGVASGVFQWAAHKVFPAPANNGN